MVSHLEANTAHLIGKLVGVLGDDGNTILAIVGIDTGRIARCDAVALEEDHHILDGLVFLPALLDLLQPALADTADERQFLGMLVQSLDRIGAKRLDDLMGVFPADTFAEIGQVKLNAIKVLRRLAGPVVSLHLAAILGMRLPLSLNSESDARLHISHRTSDGDIIVVGDATEDGKAILSTAKDDLGDSAFDCFHVFYPPFRELLYLVYYMRMPGLIFWMLGFGELCLF